jgi:hypothetical protein
MQKIIQIYPCLLKLSRKQKSVTDGQTDGRLLRGDNNDNINMDSTKTGSVNAHINTLLKSISLRHWCKNDQFC